MVVGVDGIVVMRRRMSGVVVWGSLCSLVSGVGVWGSLCSLVLGMWSFVSMLSV